MALPEHEIVAHICTIGKVVPEIRPYSSARCHACIVIENDLSLADLIKIAQRGLNESDYNSRSTGSRC